jgi:catechol 2,3-dioxygenase-like lactoylglutathione lyase family enzyme
MATEGSAKETPATTGGTAQATGFAHMLLKVADVARSERFYVDLLGFTVRPAKPLPDGRPFVPFHQGLALTAGGPGAPAQIDHIAFKATNVRAIAARLKAADATFFRELHDGIYGLTIYVADPDGNMIELYEEGERMG